MRWVGLLSAGVGVSLVGYKVGYQRGLSDGAIRSLDRMMRMSGALVELERRAEGAG